MPLQRCDREDQNFYSLSFARRTDGRAIDVSWKSDFSSYSRLVAVEYRAPLDQLQIIDLDKRNCVNYQRTYKHVYTNDRDTLI